MLDFNVRKTGEALGDDLELAVLVGQPGRVVHLKPLSQHGHRGHDLLAVYLVASAHISVLLGLEGHETVEGCGLDRFAIPAQEACGVGSAHVLGAETDEVGATVDQFSDSFEGVDLIGCVYDDGYTGVLGDGYDLRERQDAGFALLMSGIDDTTSARAYGLGQLIGSGLRLIPDLDHKGPGDGDAAVILVACALLDQKLVLEAGGVGEAGDQVRGTVGHYAGDAQGDGCETTGGRIGGLGADQLGYRLPCPVEELRHADVYAVGLLHRRSNGGAQDRATENGGTAAGANDAFHPEVSVD